MHYSFLRENSYILILKKVLKFIEGGGRGQVEVECWLTFTSKVNERKFFGGSDARSPADHLQEVQTTKEKGLDEYARVEGAR